MSMGSEMRRWYEQREAERRDSLGAPVGEGPGRPVVRQGGGGGGPAPLRNASPGPAEIDFAAIEAEALETLERLLASGALTMPPDVTARERIRRHAEAARTAAARKERRCTPRR